MSCLADNIPTDKHLFFDRNGGVSTGKYDSLNVSLRSLDDKENIFKNIELAAQHFSKHADNINLLIQGVTNKVVYVENPSLFEIEADGAVTDKPNIILALRTADCAPILFYDADNHVIGVAHAGWRGALYGIIENTLNLMISHGAQREKIVVAIGPCLQKKSFECQQDMVQRFLETNSSYQSFFTQQKETSWLFALEDFCIYLLKRNGIKNIWSSKIDTYTDENYFSYRRNCHQNLISAPKDFPSHLSTIML